MNIPVNPIGVPPEDPKEKKAKKEKPAEKIRPNTPDNANKKLTPKQKMQIKIRRVKEKKPKQPILLGGTALLLALFFAVGNLFTPAAVPYTSKAPKSDLQFTFLGDIMLGRYIQSDGEKNGYEKFYADVKDTWKNSDFVFANLEATLFTKKNANYKPLDKNIHISTDTHAVASMMDAGINAISVANNHSCDYGKKAFEKAIKWFDKKNLAYSGKIDKEAYAASKATVTEATPETEQYKPYTQLTANGKKIGFIAVADKYPKEAVKFGMLTTADSDLNNYINESALENDITIVYAHWGEEYQKTVSARQKELAHQFVDAGADIVIGCHPHVLQNIEQYNDGMIFYSLGNFIMDQNNTFTCDSAIVQYRENADGNKSFELIPVRINNGRPFITANSAYKLRIQMTLMSGFDSSKYEITDSGSIIINY